MSDTMQSISVFGTGRHAKVVADLIRSSGIYRISRFVDNQTRESFLGVPVAEQEHWRPEAGECAVVAVGDNMLRAKIVNDLVRKFPNLRFASLVHPSAVIAEDVSIGDGTVVMAGVCINTGSHFGKHCVLNTRASVDHDNRLGDFVTIAPGAVTAGNVTVGPLSWIGMGSIVLENRTIGENSMIGAGSMVNRDFPANALGYGTPCRTVRNRRGDESFR